MTTTIKPRPIWKLTDAELDKLSHSDDPRADAAWEEQNARAHDRENPPEDTPCLERPWWETER